MDIFAFVIEMLLIGIAVGLISSVLGLGGGIVMVPAFVTFIAGMDGHTAKGTSLLVIVFVSALNAWRQNRGYPIDWGLVIPLAAAAIIGGYAGGWLTARMPERIVLLPFLLMMLITAAQTFLLKEIPVPDDPKPGRRSRAGGIGLLAGLVSGATGTGGGIVMVPLSLMAGFVTNARVTALSNLVMVPMSIAGTAAHVMAPKTTDLAWTTGQVTWSLLPLVFLGAVVSSYWGRRLNTVLPLHYRRVLLGTLLIVIIIRIAWRVISP